LRAEVIMGYLVGVVSLPYLPPPAPLLRFSRIRRLVRGCLEDDGSEDPNAVDVFSFSPFSFRATCDERKLSLRKPKRSEEKQHKTEKIPVAVVVDFTQETKIIEKQKQKRSS
jgi:hypothetical protein